MTRLRAALTSLGLAALAVTAAAPAHAATTTSDPVDAAAGWLARQLVGPQDDHFEGSYTYNGQTYTFVDYGNTADAVLAFAAAGVASDAADRVTAFLAQQANLDAYAGTAPNYYPGSLAKLALVAQAQGVDPHDFGGLDLLQALRDEEAQTGPNTGLYDDPDAQFGYESVITQALAIIALDRAGGADAPSDAAVDWLVGQQCADGGFVTDVRDPSTPCQAEIDATAFAAQALVAAGRDASAALARIAALRNADGGYGQPDSNANSTAVAVQALLAGGGDASSGTAWLRSHQQGCSAPEASRGAVRYKGEYDAVTATRATTQAAQALAGKPLAAIDGSGSVAAEPTLACAAASSPTPAVTDPVTPAPAVTPVVRGASASRGVLPETGPAPTGWLALIGVALVVAGASLVRLCRPGRGYPQAGLHNLEPVARRSV